MITESHDCCNQTRARGKAEKYPLRDGSLYGCRVKYCSMRLFMAALPWHMSRMPAINRIDGEGRYGTDIERTDDTHVAL